MRRRALLLGFAATVAVPRTVAAQGVPEGAVVVLDQDALFARSLFGRRLREEIETASNALASENRRIESELEAEERDLTDRRADMEPEAFRLLADAFDVRVEGIRREQDAKTRAIEQRSDRARAVFQENASPVLFDLAREVGALVILDRRVVIAAADQVDITDAAVERIDALLGDGSDLGMPPAPRPTEPGSGETGRGGPPTEDGAAPDR